MMIDKDKIFEYNLEEQDIYLPLMLLEYIDVKKYFNFISDEVYEEYILSRYNLQMSYPDYSSYLLEDLTDWIDNNQEYKDIIL